MANASPFQNFAPGFDFLQGLVQNAGSAMPGIGQWVAPTLDPQELEKRIQELRTVQFWLEQNVRMLSTTVQALEVQKMTLSTLRTMNVQMGDLREALTPKPAEPAPAPDEITAEAQDKPTAPVDPMQWWNALTQQFGEIAANAIKDNPSAAAFATTAAAASPARAGKPAAAKTTPAARKRPVKRAAKAAPTSKPASR